MIVVTGASGRLGSRTLRNLLEVVSPADLGASVRDPSKAEEFIDEGVRVREADFGDPESLIAAFNGADVIMITSVGPPMETRFERHRAAIDAAKEVDAQRVVYTSVSKPVENHPFAATETHRLTEDYIKKSGLAYTILRDNLYAENTFVEIPQLKESGVLRWPNGKGQVAYVGIDDVAAAAATVLVDPGHDNKVYDMTGPAALSYEEIAAALGQAIGRDVRLEIISDDQYREDCRAKGMDDARIEGSLSSYVAVEEGYFADVSGDIPMLIGQPAKTLQEVLATYSG